MAKYYDTKTLVKLTGFTRQWIWYLQQSEDKFGRPKIPTFPPYTKLGVRRNGVHEIRFERWCLWREKLTDLVRRGKAEDMTYAEKVLPPPDWLNL